MARSTTPRARRWPPARRRVTPRRRWPVNSVYRSAVLTTRCSECVERERYCRVASGFASPSVGSATLARLARGRAHHRFLQLADAVFADLLVVQLSEVVGAAADRALGLDLAQNQTTFLDSDVEQVARAYAVDLPQFRRDDHPAQLVDAPCGADRSHVGLLSPLGRPRR